MYVSGVFLSRWDCIPIVFNFFPVVDAITCAIVMSALDGGSNGGCNTLKAIDLAHYAYIPLILDVPHSKIKFTYG